MKKQTSYSKCQTFCLVFLRLLIGWHFLYEGLVKVLNPSWSAYPYLMDSKGFMSGIFQHIAGNPGLLSLTNGLNTYGLTLIGLFLILGLFSRYATIGAVAFLSMYYLSHPPFLGADYMMPTEGSYLWVDKNLIEIGALVVLLVFPTSRIIGIDQYIFKSKKAA